MDDIRFIYAFLLGLPQKKYGDAFLDKYVTKSGYRRFKAFLKFFYSRIIKVEKEFDLKLPPDAICFFVETNNQYHAIAAIAKSINNSIILTSDKNVKSEMKFFYFSPALSWSEKWKVVIYLSSVFCVFGLKTFKYIDYLMYHFGVEMAAIKWIEKYNPKTLVLANDHNPMCRSVLLAFKKKKKITIYIQHASVSHLFPSLDFDLALLDGQDSKDKYLALGATNCKIELVGMPKFDSYCRKRKQVIEVTSIGVAFNLFDNYQKVIDLVFFIVQQFPDKIVYLRPHPSDKRDHSIFLKNENVRLSDSKRENSFEYIQLIDILFAGDSSIHLEATMMNIKSIYYNMSDGNIYDYYGYVGNKMIDECNTLDELKDFINNFHENQASVFLKSSYFNAAIGTEFEGRTIDKVKEIIMNTAIS